MSLKPTKRSDLNKSWTKPRQDKQIRMRPEYHLIITEGTSTEPLYFGRIKEIINKDFTGRIQLDICGAGTNTLALLDKAKQLAQKNPNGYKHIWVVYDTDDFKAEHINRTAELCEELSTSETTYHAVWSNQCIELWYLLHFSYFHSDIHRSEYWPKLTTELTKIGKGLYTKGRPDMFDVLRPYMDKAIKNALKLDDVNAGKTPTDSAPGTKMYELIQILKPYL